MFGLLKSLHSIHSNGILKKFTYNSNKSENIVSNITKFNFSVNLIKKRNELNKLALRKPHKWQVFVNDKVKIVYGKNAGMVGKVLEVQRARRMIVIEGVNPRSFIRNPSYYFNQYTKLHKTTISHKIIYLPERLDYCRLVDPRNNQIVKVSYKEDENGTRERIIKTSGEPFPKQNVFKTYAERTAKKSLGPKDTDPKRVLEKTFKGVDYVEVAKSFLKRIHNIKETEKNLLLKDKRFEHIIKRS